jgi:hypothetical protein
MHLIHVNTIHNKMLLIHLDKSIIHLLILHPNLNIPLILQHINFKIKINLMIMVVHYLEILKLIVLNKIFFL